MNKENCALKLVDEIILYYDTRSKNIKYVPTIRLMPWNLEWVFFTKQRDSVKRRLRLVYKHEADILYSQV